MIRPARPDEVPTILQLIHEVAEYERAPQEVKATEDQIRDALFGPGPQAFTHLAEQEAEVAGFALWFPTFSTWTGRQGLYLEDLFVRPAFRGQGHGRALLQQLARVCVERGYARFEWAVLDWNTPSIGFYRALGAVPKDDWTVFRLSGEALERLGC